MQCKAQTAAVAGLRRGFATQQCAKIRKGRKARGIVQRFLNGVPKGVVMLTIEIEGLHTMDAGEAREIFANGLCIRISVSSPPALEDAQEVQCAGNLAARMNGDAIVAKGCGSHATESNGDTYGGVQHAGNDILDGCSNSADDALQAMVYSKRKLRSKKKKKVKGILLSF